MTGSRHVFNVIDNRNLKLCILNSTTNVADNISIGSPLNFNIQLRVSLICDKNFM